MILRLLWIAAVRGRFQTAQIKTKSFLTAKFNPISTVIRALPPLVLPAARSLWGGGRIWIFRVARRGRVRWRRVQKFIREITRRRALEPFTGLILIAAFVVIGNQANLRALAAPDVWESDIAGLSAEEIGQVLAAVDPLTPELVEEPDRIASLLLGSDEAYFSRPELAAMAEAETLSRRDPIPYVVQKGDTMVSIAQAHDRTVATILDANGIKPEDAGKIKPGATLLIPQEDTSTSLAWLEADQRARAEAARIAAEKRAKALAAKNRNRALAAATTRETSDDGFDGAASGGFIVPVRHNGITRGVSRGHAGIDFRADMGTSVAATADGRVIEITRGWAGGFGISVLVDHGRGRSSRYAHLSDIAVGVGQTVGQGEIIGYSGNSGRSTGPHLHFEVRVGGRAVNPF